MLPSKRDSRQFIVRNNDKQMTKKYIIMGNNSPITKNPNNNIPNYFNYNNEEVNVENKTPPIEFKRSNSNSKKNEPVDFLMMKNLKYPEEKNNNFLKNYNQEGNKVLVNKNNEMYYHNMNSQEISDKDVVNSRLYQELKTKFINEKEKSLNLKRILSEKEHEITNLKQDKLQLYNKVAMMEEQIRNYEQAFEERKNNVEIAFPDFQSLLLALRYSGGMGMSMRRRTPVNNELNPDNMTYEELMHLEEQMGTVNRGFTEEQLKKLNIFIFNSKQNPNCNNQENCTICFSDFTPGNKLSKLSCGHVYHLKCIKPWLSKEKSCPVCKTIVSL